MTQTPVTKSTQDKKTKPDPSRRLARRVMPFIASDSALLPPDRWILSTLRDAYKTVAPFRRDVMAGVGLVAAVGGLVLAAAGAVATLAVLGTLTVASVAASAVVAAGGAGLAWWRGQKLWQRAKTETMPALQKMIGQRYLAYKAEELMSAMRTRRDAFLAAKNAAAVGDTSLAKKQTPSLLDIFTSGSKSAPAADAAPSVEKKAPAPKPSGKPR